MRTGVHRLSGLHSVALSAGNRLTGSDSSLGFDCDRRMRAVRADVVELEAVLLEAKLSVPDPSAGFGESRRA